MSKNGISKRILSICITAVMIFSAIGVIPPGAKVYAGVKTGTCEFFEGENVNDQDYGATAAPVQSYLVKSGTGYMIVQAGISSGNYGIEYYDQQFNRTGYTEIGMELPLFGAFYESGDNYYIVSGQENPQETDDVEVIRLTKYDKNWNRISSVGVYGANTYLPFVAGSCRIDTTGDYMVIRTAHQMYKATENGENHQANMTLLINTDSMEVLDKSCKVANIHKGYVSHSFNQFVKLENNKMIAVDHGDAYPRAIVLTKNPLDITQGSITSSDVSSVNILNIFGGTGDNNTGASVGGLEVMDNSYLVAGASVVQDMDDPNFDWWNSKTRNAFIASVNKSTNEVTMNWLTDYVDCDDSLTRTTSTPHLIKIDDSKCLVMWSRESEDKIYYATVDESGKLTSEIYSETGHLSDCVPLQVDGKLIWYVWNNNSTDFYTLSLGDMSLDITERTYFHTNEPIALDGTTATLKCIKCGKEKTGTVLTDYNVLWKKASDTYYSSSIAHMEQDEKCIIRFSNMPTSGDSNFRSMVVELADPSMGSVSMPYFDGEATITWAKEGKAVIYIYPSAVKGLDGAEKFKRTYEIWVGDMPLSGKQSSAWCTESVTYTGQPLEPSAGISGLTKGKDYEITYKNNVNAGTGTAVFTGIGNYTGTIEVNFTIEPKSLTSLKRTLSSRSLKYTGSEIMPDVEIAGLTQGKDFELTYTNNVNVGTAKVTVKGIGNYKGSATEQFLITAKSIKSMEPSLDQYSFVYTGTNIRPAGTIEGLTADKDYQLSYRNNINAGTAQAVFTGIGNYTGSATEQFLITAKSIKSMEPSLDQYSFVYTGTNIRPAGTIEGLTADKDYQLSYRNNINAGTAQAVFTGIGNYTGQTTCDFEITPASITDKNVNLLEDRYTYNGTALEPEVSVEGLVKDKDYQITYADNINTGTATATITGIGNYKDSVEKQFTIDQIDISEMKATLGTTAYQYNGFKRMPKVTISGLVQNRDYKVTYANNKNVGKATVTIAGVGNYKGKITKTFKINPKGTSISKLSKSKKAFTVKWKKQSTKMASTRITGYQIRYSTSAKMTNAKIKTVIGYGKTSLKLSKLKAKKKYYVQVRTYKTVSGAKYYSSWSKVKSVKTQ